MNDKRNTFNAASLKGTSFVKAGSVKVPDIFFQPIDTTVPELNAALSEMGGIVPSQVIFCTGKPGSGKTTLACVAGANVTRKTGKPAAVVSLEMSDFQLAAMGRRIPDFNDMVITTTWNLKDTIAELEKINPSLVILDSIQKAAMKMPGSHNHNQKLIVDEFTAYAKRTFVPVILIGHVNKGGVYIGPTHLLHEVDTHFLVNYERDTDLRTFNCEKNRFGGNNFEYVFGITTNCVWIGNQYKDTLEAEKPKNPVLQVSAQSMSNALSRFKADNAGKPSVSENASRSFCDIWLAYMKDLDKDKFVKDTHFKDVQKVHLDHNYNGVAHCYPYKGKIQMGKRMFDTNFKVGSIGYGKEQPFISRNVKDREDLFVWVLVHEWVHLYKGHDKGHTVAFFEDVQKTWKKFQDSLPAPTK